MKGWLEGYVLMVHVASNAFRLAVSILRSLTTGRLEVAEDIFDKLRHEGVFGLLSSSFAGKAIFDQRV